MSTEVKVIIGDALEQLKTLPDGSVNCCVTSPPYYGLRDYGVAGQIGLEATPDEFVAKLVDVFREVRRVLRDDGTCWVNLGDSYSGSGRGDNPNGKQSTNAGTRFKPPTSGQTFGIGAKQLFGIPWRVAFALQADGWILRQDIIWHKPNPMPESVKDRCTKAHEYLFLLAKKPRYWFDANAIREPQKESSLKRLKTGWNGNNKRDWPGSAHNNFDRYMGKSEEEIALLPGANRRSVWSICPRPYKGAHFAVFPPALVEPCIKAGCPAGGTVLDPFGGSGTTGQVAKSLGRNAILIELNHAYKQLIDDRITK